MCVCMHAGTNACFQSHLVKLEVSSQEQATGSPQSVSIHKAMQWGAEQQAARTAKRGRRVGVGGEEVLPLDDALARRRAAQRLRGPQRARPAPRQPCASRNTGLGLAG